jgi:hypothetical protein
LRLVAQYGDAGNLYDPPDHGAMIRHKLAVLAGHCETVGRRFEDIDVTVSTRFIESESPAEFADRAAMLRDHGATHLVLFHSWTVESFEALGKLIPAVAEL